ncbi:sugar 3,4-ketoisomerase [uncultured Helicobacter sp.]|uniref:sugar 3,4-ketoisomerase n=1 Tax=uncultured Helicobacter sp. TaxID=175537 RepID=UPI00374EED0A
MAKLITAKTITDNRGSLSVLEGEIGFAIKRVFYIYDVLGSRGGHAHHKTKLCLICLGGSCEITIKTKKQTQTYKLDNPTKCLILEPKDYHTMQEFSQNATLLALASEVYDENDYITEIPNE